MRVSMFTNQKVIFWKDRYLLSTSVPHCIATSIDTRCCKQLLSMAATPAMATAVKHFAKHLHSSQYIGPTCCCVTLDHTKHHTRIENTRKYTFCTSNRWWTLHDGIFWSRLSLYNVPSGIFRHPSVYHRHGPTAWINILRGKCHKQERVSATRQAIPYLDPRSVAWS